MVLIHILFGNTTREECRIKQQEMKIPFTTHIRVDNTI